MYPSPCQCSNGRNVILRLGSVQKSITMVCFNGKFSSLHRNEAIEMYYEMKWDIIMHVCFLLKNIRTKFRIRLCLQVHDSRCSLVLFTDFTLKLCNSYVVSAANSVSLNLKTLYIVVSIFYKRLFISTTFFN